MRALLTGSTGFIGSHLAEELLKKGYQVTCLVRKRSNLKWIEGLDVTLHYGDCLDSDSLADAVEGVEMVFHIAGLTRAKRKNDFFEVNVTGTENLLKAVASGKPSVKRIICLSSLAAVGPSRNGTLVNEDTEPRPVSSYGQSKLDAERIAMKYSSTLPITIIRAPAVYGPRDKDFYLLYKILNRGVFPYWGESYYSLIYVEDLIKGIVSAAESPAAEGKTFFISNESPSSNLDIAKAIADALSTRPIRIPLPKSMVAAIAGAGKLFGANNSIINVDKARELSYSNWVCDPAKARIELGFSSQVPTDKGFTWTANWYRIHRWL